MPHLIPLRERCNIALRVDTAAKSSAPKSRSKKTTPLPPRSSRPTPCENERPVTRPTGMSEVIPGMYLSFHDDNYKAVKVGRDFTHMISISTSSTPGRAIEYASSSESSVRALHLTIPRTHSTRLSLTPEQLRRARDFLSLVLPYTQNSGPAAWRKASTRLLVSTPFGKATDAVAVVAGYLSFTSGAEVYSVLAGMDENEELSHEWKSQICEKDERAVQAIADEED